MTSAKKSKLARQVRRARSTRQVNLDKMKEAATSVLATDPGGIPESRVSQVAVGWLRAAMGQAQAIAALAAQGLDAVAAPNRRSLLEILLRLQWLLMIENPSDRQGALDAMIEEERRLAKSGQQHYIDMGLIVPPPVGDFDGVATLPTSEQALVQQAKKLVEAAKAANGVGPYVRWRDDTQYTHATVRLAAANAPAAPSCTLGRGVPPTWDDEFEALLMLLIGIVGYTLRLLVDDGVTKDSAGRFFDAFFDGIRKAI